MPRKVVDKPSFLGGEVSPLIEGRSDLVQHQWGASELKNWITLTGGAVTRRTPTKYMRKTYSTGTTTAAMFYMYDTSDGGTTPNIDGFIIEVTKSGTTLSFSIICSDGTMMGTTVGGVYNPASARFTATVGSNFDIYSLQAEQYGNMMYFVGDGMTPKVLYRSGTVLSSVPGWAGIGTYGDSTWTLENYIGSTRNSRGAWLSTPYLDENVADIRMAISNIAVGTGRTLSCQNAAAASVAYFHPDHVGAYFRVSESGVDGYCVVTAVGGGGAALQSSCTVDVVKAFNSTSYVPTWAEGAWSTRLGFPKAITRYSQCLVMAGTTTKPDTIWMSQEGDYDQMACLPADEGELGEPLNFTLDGARAQQIKWMVGGKKLTIGTDESEWVGTVTNDGTNIFVQFNEENSAGSNAVRGVKAGHSIAFSSKKSLSELSFNFDYDSYTSINLSVLADHIGTASPIKRIQVQKQPYDIIWVVDEAGSFFGLSRDSMQKVAAWHSHEIAGVSTKVKDILVVRNYLFLIVERSINSTTTYTMERMELSAVVDAHPTLVDEIFLDCQVEDNEGITSEKSTWAALAPHLASTTAYAVAWRYPTDFGVDPYVVHNGAVSVNGSGDVTINADANVIVVGILGESILRLLPFEAGESAPELHAMGTKRADHVNVRLYESFGLKIGKNRILRKTGWEENATFDPIPFDTSVQTSPPTFTGLKSVPVPTGNDTDGSFALAMEDPWPCTILSITSRVVANEI